MLQVRMLTEVKSGRTVNQLNAECH